MKKAILIILVVVGISLDGVAQYAKSHANPTRKSEYYVYNPPKGWGEPELFVPVLIIGGTFGTNEYLGKSVSYGTRSGIALGGVLLSVGSHFLFRGIREHRTNKKVIVDRRY